MTRLRNEETFWIGSAVLRMSGSFSPEELADALGFELTMSRPVDDVGVTANIVVCEQRYWDDAAELVFSAVEQLDPSMRGVWDSNAPHLLDISIMLSVDAVCASLSLLPENARRLASIGVELMVSAYACSPDPTRGLGRD